VILLTAFRVVITGKFLQFVSHGEYLTHLKVQLIEETLRVSILRLSSEFI
jgi:hypothetical protein